MKPAPRLLTIITLFCCSIFMLLPQHAHAQTALNMDQFAALPIAHEGRVKPIESFAKITLKRLSGKENVTLNEQTISATQWLAISIFDPQNTIALPVFEITNEALRTELKLDKDESHVSLSQLAPLLNTTQKDVATIAAKEQNTLSQNEAALLEIHENAATLTQLMRSFSAFLPLDLVLPEQMRAEIQPPITFLKIAPYEQSLKEAVQNISRTKGTDPNTYNYDEMNTAQTAFQFTALRAAGETNTVLKIIPNTWDKGQSDKQNLWLSPWQSILQGEGSPESAFLLSQWEELTGAYRDNNADLWNAVLDDLQSEMRIQAENLYTPTRFTAENLYLTLKPYLWVILFYAAALICIYASNLPSLNTNKNTLEKFALAASIIGILMHSAAFATRIYILDRAPLGTLYETLLFVALICSIIGLILAIAKGPKHIFLGIGTMAALFLLSIAPIFSKGGESLEVLSAVLNTNFWLSTHVLCITTGYAVCIIAALIAHAALITKIKNGNALTLQKLTHQFSILALLLTAIGTILGGIWADQSWGRFWGWDPKENGALLIVLWLIWAQHGRLSGKMTGPKFLAAIAALNIVIALSWFGVNLLGVGLHAYGFTTGILAGLIAFCIIQSAVITALYIKAK